MIFPRLRKIVPELRQIIPILRLITLILWLIIPSHQLIVLSHRLIILGIRLISRMREKIIPGLRKIILRLGNIMATAGNSSLAATKVVHSQELSYTSDAMTEELPGSARRVQQALAAAGIAAEVIELPQSTRTARDAAAAIGCRVEQIAKSLLFRRLDTGQPVLVVASGANRVDEQLVSAHLGAGVAKADADFVRSATGFAIGGVPPLGHPEPIRTLIDQDLLQLDAVWAAAGTPHAVVSLTPRQLLQATGGQVVRVSRAPEPRGQAVAQP